MLILKIISNVKVLAKLPKDLFKIINVTGDGYCLYRSLYMVLNRKIKDINFKQKTEANKFEAFLQFLSDVEKKQNIKENLLATIKDPSPECSYFDGIIIIIILLLILLILFVH